MVVCGTDFQVSREAAGWEQVKRRELQRRPDLHGAKLQELSVHLGFTLDLGTSLLPTRGILEMVNIW